jgi:hypothetical protein
MHKSTACSILMMASALVACGKDKHQEPAMTPAAGDQWNQRQQTTPSYTEEQAQPPMQPESQQPAGGEWQPGPEQPMSDQPAVNDPWAAQPQPGKLESKMLAETRCRRELRCGHIGDNKKYPTAEECETKLMSQGDMALQGCANGVSKDALTTCVTAIQSKGCDSPMENLTEYEQCKSTVLCAQ